MLGAITKSPQKVITSLPVKSDLGGIFLSMTHSVGTTPLTSAHLNGRLTLARGPLGHRTIHHGPAPSSRVGR